ncbi:MAG: hypothetical protein IJ696_01200 [Ruminococcus sp.]|nr:hypothetical protein [Ruminococcus sp.]
MQEKILCQTSSRYTSASQYIISVGSVYSRKNRVFPAAAITLILYCGAMLFLPIAFRLKAKVLIVLVFITVYSKVLSYLTAAIQFFKNKAEILSSPGTLILYQSYMTEYCAGCENTVRYTQIKEIMTTKHALALFTEDMAVFIPIKGAYDKKAREILAILHDNGAGK